MIILMLCKFYEDMIADGLRFVVLGSNPSFFCKTLIFRKPRTRAWESLKIILLVLDSCLLLPNLRLCLIEIRASFAS